MLKRKGKLGHGSGGKSLDNQLLKQSQNYINLNVVINHPHATLVIAQLHRAEEARHMVLCILVSLQL